MQNKFFMLWFICKCCSPEDCCRQFRLCLVFQVAELLLFVIDNQTRAVVSLCEMAYLVGESWAYLVLKLRLLISLVNCRIFILFIFIYFLGVLRLLTLLLISSCPQAVKLLIFLMSSGVTYLFDELWNCLFCQWVVRLLILSVSCRTADLVGESWYC